MLARALRRTGRRASAAPAQIDPSAYAAATSEKLPAPRPSVDRERARGTPTIQVPDESVTATPARRPTAASIGPRAQRGEALADARPLCARLGHRPRVRTPTQEQRPRAKNETAFSAKNDADRQEREQQPGERPAADGERVGRRPHEAVRLLDVASVDELGQQPAVGRVEVARRGGQHERRGDEHGERTGAR